MEEVMNAAAYLALITGALKFAMDTAKDLGLDLPGDLDYADLEREANEAAAKLLPAEIVTLAIAVNAIALKAGVQIAKLGTSPLCPKCSNVATQHISKTVSGPAEVSLSCDKCGWTSA